MPGASKTNIEYRTGYKYSLWTTVEIPTKVTGYSVSHKLFALNPNGLLTIYEDYPWDGPSGPTIDTPSSMRASLVHDALYEMMRLGLIPQSCFTPANEELMRIAIEDGMWVWRAKLWFAMLERFGSVNAALRPEKILTAP